MPVSFVNKARLEAMYTKENPLQALGKRATAILKNTDIEPFKGHLGNPMGPQHEPTNELLARYFQQRGGMPDNAGYADVAGHPEIRKVIALALNKINRLQEHPIEAKNVLGVTGGTGALNIALSIYKDPTILFSDPAYPSWGDISKRLKVRQERFTLSPDDDYLLNEETLEKRLQEIKAKDAAEGRTGKPITLIYHYPHNPTGKTLDEAEARQVAQTLSNLCKKHKELYLVQEDLYLATTASDRGIYTPLPYLDERARQRTVWLHSPSKMGHAQDRGAVVCAYNNAILQRLRGAISFDMLGASTPAMLATASTLAEIAQGGVDARPLEEPLSPMRKSNFRYEVADYYQARMKFLYDAVKEIENKAHVKILAGKGEMPGGAYYLYPDFECLRGKEIPKGLLGVFTGKTHFENSQDIATALENAHLLGLRPMTVAPGALFENRKNPMTVRIATVEPDLTVVEEGANTLKGLVEKTLSVGLGAEFKVLETIQQEDKKRRDSKPASQTLEKFIWAETVFKNLSEGQERA